MADFFVQVPPATPIPALGPAMARLAQTLTDLTVSHAKTTSSLTSISEERAAVEAREVELRASIAKAEAKRSWFAAFKEWVESVATFLDEKVHLLLTLSIRPSPLCSVPTVGKT